MPDWCYTSLIMQGSEKDLDSIEGTGLDFEKILPTPPHLLGWPRSRAARLIMRAYGLITGKDPSIWPAVPRLGGWYDWRDERWGTKWTADVTDFRRTSEGLEVIMLTAYGPPIPVLRHLTARYGVLIHAYHRYEGGAFQGTQTFAGGEIIDECLDFDVPEILQ